MNYFDKERMNIEQALNAHCEGKLKAEDMFWDWFCSDKALHNRGEKLIAKLKTIINSSKIDCQKQYVWFKNNCPMRGPLYDDFRISDKETGNVIYTITPKSGHTGKAEVYGKENDFNEPLAEGTWNDIKRFFLN